MKRPKERLHRVTVIGATPAGIAATNKLGELGIPLTLVDSDYDLDKKLSRDEWILKSGIPLNHAHRPGLIRILRNPAIRCIFPATVSSIKHNRQGFRVHLNIAQTFVDPDKCTLCGRCVEICPVLLADGEKAIQINSQRSLPGRPVMDKRRRPLCQENCPLGVNVQGYIALVKAGRFTEALDLIRENNVLPGICGRICTHPCEAVCRRGDLDEPVAIMDIKRFVADHERIHPRDIPAGNVRKKSGKIVIIGSGPAGIAAAADLARFGYEVTVFEKEKEVGGLLRYGIGRHRLPRDIIDNDLEYIKKLGVQFITGRSVDLARDMDVLKKDFDAVILSIGTGADLKLGVPGETLEGVENCLSFLGRFYRNPIKVFDEKVAVIGDGNAAFDLARTLLRLGARVTILSWFPEDLIPAHSEEIRAAKEEGILIRDCTQTVAFLGQNGKLNGLRCMTTQPGEPDAQGIPWPVIIPDRPPFELEFNRAFVAIGQRGALQSHNPSFGFNVSTRGLIEVDEYLRTNLPGVYAVGDSVSGPSSVVNAMAEGRRVARMVHGDICKTEVFSPDLLRPEDKDFPEIPADIPSQARTIMPERQPAVRKDSFSEVSMGLSEQQVLLEADRCLQCGVCSECLHCVDACGAIQAINHSQLPEETNEQTGVVIIADPKISPTVKGDDVIRVYGPKTAKPDVNAMFIRGFAAASRAMILLGGTFQRPKGYGLSFSTPDPGLSPEIRMGIFVCKCNNAFGWLDDMSQYVAGLESQDDVVHAQVVNSACTHEGTLSIIRTIREKGLTRVVLASCVCCPLNFICSACTDQRSRLKNALFTGTGISRSMVQTCNLKGEVLRLLKRSPSLALKKFAGFIDRSMNRARRLKPIPDLIRNYNFTTAVIGTSEVARSSALTLAEAGLEVFWFPRTQEPPVEILDHPNVHSFGGFTVKELSGTLGNFHIIAESGDSRQIMTVGTVILDEKSRKKIKYIHQEGLPGRTVSSSMQEMGVPGVPFFYPGATAISGLFLAEPTGINVSNQKKGAAAAAQAAAIMPREPRHKKGYTVEVDESLCRSCGRCIRVCPYQAVTLHKNAMDGWAAWVDETLCKGCGNCISVCPTSAVDSPYRNQDFLEQTIEKILLT
ncbi:MAG: FAD-dependent oxidoreductase [Deltaproteobacteria bacterium]|nr:FAD-dependent oxidoreductase [Deltaproteobacteria bacterium]